MLPKIYEGKDVIEPGIRMDEYRRVKLPEELIERLKIESGCNYIAIIQRYQKGLIFISYEKAIEFRKLRCPFIIPTTWITTLDKKGRLRIPDGIKEEGHRIGEKPELIRSLIWGLSSFVKEDIFLEAGLTKKDYRNNKVIMFEISDGIEIWEKKRWELEKRRTRVFFFEIKNNTGFKFTEFYFIEDDKNTTYAVRRGFRPHFYEKSNYLCILESIKRCILVTSHSQFKKTLRCFGEMEETETITSLDMHYTVPFGIKIENYGHKIILKFDKSCSMAKREAVEKIDKKEVIVCEFEKRLKDLYVLKTKSVVRKGLKQ